MSGVTQRHASAVACPIVMKDLYLIPEGDRRLLSGVVPAVSPAAELDATFDVEAASADQKETFTLAGRPSEGSKKVRLSYVNDYCCEGGDRNIRLDRLVVTSAGGRVVSTHELEEMDRVSRYCDRYYFDGVLDDIWVRNEYGPDWDWKRVNKFIWEDTDMPDPHHVARTWVVMLAYLMTDPRYLHL